jgi:hypothetical protein
MADTKITALTAITTVDPAVDVLPIVDVSDTTMAASGTTKKITSNQILGAGGTATLASATITGDLTVDTSTLKVDSANNRVGILTATPAAGYALDVRGILAAGNSAGTIIGGISFSTRPEIGAISNHSLGLIANNTTMHLITPAGVFDWYDGAGGTRMTLNSTGLGIGGTAIGTKLEVVTSTSGSLGGTATVTNSAAAAIGNAASFNFRTNTNFLLAGYFGARIEAVTPAATNDTDLVFYNYKGVTASGDETMRITSSGNVGVGVTPSYRIHAAVASGSNQNIARFQVTGASNGLTITWDNTTSKMIVNFSNLPTSSAGLASGDLWIDTAAGNTLKVA